VAGRKLQLTPAADKRSQLRSATGVTLLAGLAHLAVRFWLSKAAGVNDDGIAHCRQSLKYTVIRIGRCLPPEKFRQATNQSRDHSRYPFHGDAVRVMYLQQMSVVDECFWIGQ